MMINLTAKKARQITERSSQSFKRELIDDIESDIIRRASKGYKDVITTKFLHTESFSILKLNYREDIQNVKNQLVEAGYSVDVKETDISEGELGLDAVIDIKVSW